MAKLLDILRAALGRPKSIGHSVDGTGDVNQDPPILDIGESARSPSGGIARTDRENNWQRFVQTFLAVANIEELGSVVLPANSTFTLDPNVLNVWELNRGGSSLAITVTALSALSAAHARSVYNGARRWRTIEMIINWTTAGAHTLTVAGCEWTNGTAPTMSSGVSTDIVILQINSAGRLIGFVSGNAFAEP